ncbi:MAG: hypothetical protein H6R10_3055 [Rhodocyclaceae bacterium]|nr:hypothetical protein [Rhodocyclaceae bacterium]
MYRVCFALYGASASLSHCRALEYVVVYGVAFKTIVFDGGYTESA